MVELRKLAEQPRIYSVVHSGVPALRRNSGLLVNGWGTNTREPNPAELYLFTMAVPTVDLNRYITFSC